MRLVAFSALLAALAVAAGAFGAHGLADRLTPRESELWETGSRYLAYVALGGLAMAGVSSGALSGRGAVAVTLVLAGGALFAVTLFGLALGGPQWLGAVTPLGGIAIVLGFTLFAIVALRGGASN